MFLSFISQSQKNFKKERKTFGKQILSCQRLEISADPTRTVMPNLLVWVKLKVFILIMWQFNLTNPFRATKNSAF